MPYVYPVCAEIWLWAMDIVRAAHRFGPKGPGRAGPVLDRKGCARGLLPVVATSSVVCCKVYKLQSSLFSPPSCCWCRCWPFLITSFEGVAAYKKKNEENIGMGVRGSWGKAQPNQKLLQMPWFGFGLRVSATLCTFFYLLFFRSFFVLFFALCSLL